MEICWYEAICWFFVAELSCLWGGCPWSQLASPRWMWLSMQATGVRALKAAPPLSRRVHVVPPRDWGGCLEQFRNESSKMERIMKTRIFSTFWLETKPLRKSLPAASSCRRWTVKSTTFPWQLQFIRQLEFHAAMLTKTWSEFRVPCGDTPVAIYKHLISKNP